MTDDRGTFVALVGPDGVGKTSVAVELIARTNGRYFHFRPPLRRRWTTPTPGETVIAKRPHNAGLVVSLLRICKTLVTFWLGYLLSVRPEVRAGGVVVADRWAYGYLVHPRKLGTIDSPRLARLILAVLPQPEMTFALLADPEVIHARKKELGLQELSAEVEAWTSIPAPRLIHIDASQPVDQIVDAILSHLRSS